MTRFNYIKAHRRRWNFSQQELAFLLGYGNNSTVSRIEQGKQEPSIPDLIALELLFEKAACRLFPDLYSEISSKLLYRLDMFEQHLCEEPATQTNHEKLDAIRSARRSLAQDNENRI